MTLGNIDAPIHSGAKVRNSSVHVHFVRATLVHARRQNVDIPSLLTRSRISPQLIGIQDARVSARQFADLLSMTMYAMNDELVGHTPHPVPIGSSTAMTHWLINTRTLKQVIRRFCHFYTLIGKGFQPRLEVRDNSAILFIEPWSQSEDYKLFAYELFLFACYRLLCWLTREKIPIHRLHMPVPRPSHHQEYQYLFYGYPVYFDQPQCSISFNKSVLDLPIRQTLDTLNELLLHPLYGIIAQNYDHSSWSARVMNLINQNPSANIGLPDIAVQLGTNPHTLRRRLADEGQNFIDLKREVKRDLAIHYLSGSQISVEEVAEKIGFSEASAFIRAFKQWTGVTPYTYRKDR